MAFGNEDHWEGTGQCVGLFFVPGDHTLDFWTEGPVGLGPAIKGTCFFFLSFLTMSKVINGPLAEPINFFTS